MRRACCAKPKRPARWARKDIDAGMNHAKKLSALAVAVCICLCACTGCATGQPGAQGAPLRVVTSFYPMYLFTANVAKDVSGVSVHNMAAPEVGCLHDYQLLPGDLRALEEADVLVVNGAGMEQFLDKVRALHPELPVIEASAGIALLEEDGAAHVHGDGDEHAHNPHVWVDPRNAAVQVCAIARALAELDPLHAAAYAANAEAYAGRLQALHQRMADELAGASKRDIFTFHEAFAYFAAALDLRVVGVIEREPGTEPGTRELAEIVDAVRAAGVPPLFVEPQYAARSAEIIAKETGARIFTLDPVVTGPMALDAYEQAMERNLAALRDALGAE